MVAQTRESKWRRVTLALLLDFLTGETGVGSEDNGVAVDAGWRCGVPPVRETRVVVS